MRTVQRVIPLKTFLWRSFKNLSVFAVGVTDLRPRQVHQNPKPWTLIPNH
jgi:hypothetical protein